MENEKNAFLLDDEKIVEMGVSVFEVTNVPGRNKPFVTPHYIISLCPYIGGLLQIL